MSNTALMAHKKQPPGLYVLFFTELWERFSYYGMRALLILYLTKALLFDDAGAFAIYGAYGTLVYISPIIGGLFADRLFGYRRTILIGGLLMAAGQFILTVQQLTFFHYGLAFLVIGNGMLKPNLATLLGKLYDQKEELRETGFTLYYVGINLGGTIAPLVCGIVGELYGWHYGFGLAGVGMILGLLVFYFGEKYLEGHGKPPNPERLKRRLLPGISVEMLCYLGIIVSVPLAMYGLAYAGLLLIAITTISFGSIIIMALSCSRDRRNKIFALLFFMSFAMVFWSLMEQTGSSLNLFAERNISHNLWGMYIPTTFFQSLNPAFILLFGPIFAVMWVFLEKHALNPSTGVKFSMGTFLLGLGFAFFAMGANHATVSGHASLIWLVLGYMLITMGELFIEPIGMSLVTRLSPKHVVGMMMGCWFLVDGAISNFVAAKIATLTSASKEAAMDPLATAVLYYKVFYEAAIAAIIFSAFILLLSPWLKRMVGNLKTT